MRASLGLRLAPHREVCLRPLVLPRPISDHKLHVLRLLRLFEPQRGHELPQSLVGLRRVIVTVLVAPQPLVLRCEGLQPGVRGRQDHQPARVHASRKAAEERFRVREAVDEVKPADQIVVGHGSGEVARVGNGKGEGVARSLRVHREPLYVPLRPHLLRRVHKRRGQIHPVHPAVPLRQLERRPPRTAAHLRRAAHGSSQLQRRSYTHLRTLSRKIRHPQMIF
mmetsp:Transcript_50567/g.110683  ORF Transcript_50567/g.110683 Transcript_50567/m.110683 type:complete len:223 (-) Transcript_50567:2605-3273(-)